MTTLLTLPQLISHFTERYADKTAIIYEEKQITFRQLRIILDLVNEQLFQFGVSPKDSIVICFPDTIDTLISFLAISRFAVCVPINPSSTRQELTHILDGSKVKHLLLSDQQEIFSEELNPLNVNVIRIKPFIDPDNSVSGWTVPLELSVDANDTALMLHTSGTTSKPKLAPLSHRNLLTSIRNLVSSLELTEHDSCLNMMPPFHIGALLDLLLAPLSLGNTVIIAKSPQPDEFFALMNRHKPSWFQAVPTMLQAMMKYDSDDAKTYFASCQNLAFIRAVSSKLDLTLRKSIEQQFDVPVIEIYGMTETAGVICSPPKQQIKPSSVGKPVSQSVVILDGEGNQANAGKTGRIIVKGDNVFSGYGLLSHEKKTDDFIDGWFLTGDEGYFDEQGYLFLTGRTKEMINRGGEKIAPLEIDEVAVTYPDVEEVAAFAMPHASLGESVAIAVVSDKMLNVEHFKQYLSQFLSPYKIPQKIIYLDALPKNKGGKLLRHQLPALIDEQNNTDPEDELPLDGLEQQVADLWKATLQVESIRRNDDFFELGGDSLSTLSFLTALQNCYQCQLSPVDLYDHPTLDQFKQHLQSVLEQVVQEKQAHYTDELPSEKSKMLQAYLAGWKGKRLHKDAWIVGLNTLSSKRPVFWCAQGFEEIEWLAQALGQDQPMYGMRSLSLIGEKSTVDNQLLAKRYVDELLDLQKEDGYIIGGFCEGGKIAFEMALELQRRHKDVALLLLHDQVMRKTYQHRVALLFCKPNLNNPFGLYHQPERGWYQFYKGDVSIHQLSMEHHYSDANLPELAKAIQQEIQCVESNQPSFNQSDLASIATHVLPNDAYQCRLSMLTSLPHFMSPNQTLMIDLKIKNLSDHIWYASEKSGVMLASRWFNHSNEPRSMIDGKAFFDSPLNPQEERVMTIEVKTPSKTGGRALLIDLIDDGVTWFHEQGSEPVRARMQVFWGGRFINSFWRLFKTFLFVESKR